MGEALEFAQGLLVVPERKSSSLVFLGLVLDVFSITFHGIMGIGSLLSGAIQ